MQEFYSCTRLYFVRGGQYQLHMLCNLFVNSLSLTFVQSHPLKPIFHLATLFARREAKTRIRQRDWLKLADDSMNRPKLAKWKIGLRGWHYVNYIYLCKPWIYQSSSLISREEKAQVLEVWNYQRAKNKMASLQKTSPEFRNFFIYNSTLGPKEGMV